MVTPIVNHCSSISIYIYIYTVHLYVYIYISISIYKCLLNSIYTVHHCSSLPPGRRISSPGLWVSGSRRAAATGGSCPRKRDKWRQPAVKVGKCEHFQWSCLKIDLQLEVFFAFFNQPFGGTKHGKLIA